MKFGGVNKIVIVKSVDYMITLPGACHTAWQALVPSRQRGKEKVIGVQGTYYHSDLPETDREYRVSNIKYPVSRLGRRGFGLALGDDLLIFRVNAVQLFLDLFGTRFRLVIFKNILRFIKCYFSNIR